MDSAPGAGTKLTVALTHIEPLTSWSPNKGAAGSPTQSRTYDVDLRALTWKEWSPKNSTGHVGAREPIRES